jgi:hypothetical protein
MNMPICKNRIRIPFPVHNNIDLSHLLLNHCFENEPRGYPPIIKKMEGYFTQNSPSLYHFSPFNGMHPGFFEVSILPISPSIVFEISHINANRMLGSLNIFFKSHSPKFNSWGSWYSIDQILEVYNEYA